MNSISFSTEKKDQQKKKKQQQRELKLNEMGQYYIFYKSNQNAHLLSEFSADQFILDEIIELIAFCIGRIAKTLLLMLK